MHSSSPTLRYPETPSSRNPLQYRPLNSSPLADSPESPKTSPAAAAQARRKSQYKSHVLTTPLFSRTATAARGSTRRSASSTVAVESDPQKSFLRGRLQARCIERASKAREKAVYRTRQASFGPSSDDQVMDEDEEEEDDDDIMQDELFRRIVANANRREKHSYRLSYAQEVGSSFDPDIEDVSSWEAELLAINSADTRGETMPAASTSGNSSTFSSRPEQEDFDEDIFTPADVDEEELAEYAEEYYTRQGAVADFEDLPEEELFGWSGEIDSESISPISTRQELTELTEEDSMDVS